MIKIEVCCGSVKDVEIASQFPITRIELNSALNLGGLTPSLSTLILSKELTDIPIICMVRERGGNFVYSSLEIQVMYSDASLLLENGADGIAFGFVTEDGKVDKELVTIFTKLAHSHNKEAVFHRAFDTLKDPIQALQDLADCQIDRILTSGQKADAPSGITLLKELNDKQLVPILAGAGINVDNVAEFIRKTGIKEIHGSFSENAQNTSSYSEVSFEIQRTQTSKAVLMRLFKIIS